MTIKGFNFQQAAVLLSVSFRAPSCRRKVDAQEMGTDADKALLHVAKDIVDSDEYRAVGRKDGEFKNGYLLRRAIPCNVFRRGVYPLPVGLLAEVDEALQRFTREREKRVEAFLDEYPAKKLEAERRLGSLYDARDYPSVARLRAAFSVEVHYVTLGTPEQLKGVSLALFTREQQKAEAMWSEAAEDIRAALRAAFAELVAAMASRLSGSADGKRRRIVDSGVERLTDFLDSFDKRNLTADTDLKALVAKAKAVMGGADASALRDSEKLRGAVGAEFAKINAAVAGWVELKPGRKITLEDEG